MNDYEPVAPKLITKPVNVDSQATMYFWAAVAGVVCLGLIVFVVLYALSQGNPPSTPDTAEAVPAVMRQLPLYMSSTQFQDPAESV